MDYARQASTPLRRAQPAHSGGSQAPATITVAMRSGCNRRRKASLT
jgi:hypothetical protein